MFNDIGNQFSEIEKKNILIMQRVFQEIWNEKRFEIIDEIISPEFISHYEHEMTTGLNNFKERIVYFLCEAIPDLEVVVDGYLANRDCVVSRWRAQGTHKGELFGVHPTGKEIKFSGISWTMFSNGKLVENWNSWSMSYLIRELLSEVKHLRGILPICSFCKKIRDDKGYWEKVEVYIHKYSEADFSHSICPECVKKHYPDIHLDSEKNGNEEEPNE